MMHPVTAISGDSPLILGQPHSGTYVPESIASQLNDLGRKLTDTDWHVTQLYAGLAKDVTIVQANFSRYVIDANRDPEGISLYPGQNTTGLIPLTTFDDEPIWKRIPTETETAQRLKAYHEPYHTALKAEIARVKSIHGFAVLYDCHSIRSKVPFLFDDQLPDLNIGDNLGVTCAPAISGAVQAACQNSLQYSHVVNGRFRGGWTTRHYGDPAENVHAVQMEIAQRNYLETENPPFAYDDHKAESLRHVLREILTAIQSIPAKQLIKET